MTGMGALSYSVDRNGGALSYSVDRNGGARGYQVNICTVFANIGVGRGAHASCVPQAGSYATASVFQ